MKRISPSSPSNRMKGRLYEVARLFVPFIHIDNAPPTLERCRKRTGFLPRYHAVSANSFGSRTRL
jgi:hypothetical protein